MSGLDNMKSQILDEATRLAEVKLTEAKTKADLIVEEATREVTAQTEKISVKAQDEVENYAQRITSSNEMQRKQAILRAKQEVIADILEKAYDEVVNLDTEAYFEMIKKMLKEYVLPENGVICFSKKDLGRMPAGFEAEIQKIAVEKGGTLSLSGDAKDMIGGFILVYGGIEENCTIKALFDSKSDELSDKVHGALFN